MRKAVLSRLDSKTLQEQFLRVLREDFTVASRVADAILAETTEALHGTQSVLKNGQFKVTLTRREAKTGQALSEASMAEVIWALNAGKDDIRILEEQGPVALRQVKIMRLLTEALELRSRYRSTFQPQPRQCWTLYPGLRACKIIAQKRHTAASNPEIN